jgi:hypothetical protein
MDGEQLGERGAVSVKQAYADGAVAFAERGALYGVALLWCG